MTNPTEMLADRLEAGSALYDPQDRKLAVAALRAFASPPSDVDIAKIGRDSANRIMALCHTPPSDVGGRSDMAMLADEIEKAVRLGYVSRDPNDKDRFDVDGLVDFEDQRLIAAALRQSTPSPGEPSVVDFDDGEISVRLNGNELRGWSYKDDAERRVKMLAAREYVEGYCEGRDAK